MSFCFDGLHKDFRASSHKESISILSFVRQPRRSTSRTFAEKREVLQVWTNDNVNANDTVKSSSKASRKNKLPSKKRDISKNGASPSVSAPEEQRLYSTVLLFDRLGEVSLKEFAEKDNRRNRLKQKHGVELLLSYARSGKTVTMQCRADDVDKIAELLNDFTHEAEQEGLTVFGDHKVTELKSLRMLIPTALCGQLVGTEGSVIQAISQNTETRLKLQPSTHSRKSTGSQAKEYSETRLLDIGLKDRPSAVLAVRQILRRLADSNRFGVLKHGKAEVSETSPVETQKAEEAAPVTQ